jgi:GNAT superfamily N-acetyltransferase
MAPADPLHLERLSAEQVRPLRTAILRPHFDEGRLCEFAEDEAADTAHYGLVDQAFVPRAVATFIHSPFPEDPDAEAIQLRGMCVDEAMQRQGLGERLLEGALGQLAVRFPAVELVWCNARLSAADFYERMGFERTGPVFEVEPIGPHIVMWRRLPAALA